VTDTAGRLLRLLSLLQRRAEWTGPQLADELGVTTRTVRRDVDRLRGLGYPVDAAPGIAGGYRLAPGASLPPLLLDDDEATAIAVALSASMAGPLAGVAEPALAALAKLDRVLPPHLRARAAALRATTVPLGTAAAAGEQVDANHLLGLAQASANRERVVVTYRDRSGRHSDRRVEPFRLVPTGRRWYLLAHDLDRSEWRTFRVDRIEAVSRTGHRFELTDLPDLPDDPAAFVGEAITVAPYRIQARVRLAAPVAEVAHRVPPTVGTLEADGEATILTVGADDLEPLAGHLVGLGLPLEVLDPPELREHLVALGRQLVRAHGRSARGQR
jgi:predicted DNA-binding transcriptional regulator YafY